MTSSKSNLRPAVPYEAALLMIQFVARAPCSVHGRNWTFTSDDLSIEPHRRLFLIIAMSTSAVSGIHFRQQYWAGNMESATAPKSQSKRVIMKRPSYSTIRACSRRLWDMGGNPQNRANLRARLVFGG